MPERRFRPDSPKRSSIADFGRAPGESVVKKTHQYHAAHERKLCGRAAFSTPGMRRFLRQTTYCCAASQNLFFVPERTERTTGREKNSHAMQHRAAVMRWQRAGLSTRFDATRVL